MKSVKKYLSNQRGVTLIELLAVIVIIGILAVVAVPVVLNQIDNAETSAKTASGEVILDAAQRYFIKNSSEADVTVETLINGGFLKSLPKNYVKTNYIEKATPNIIYTSSSDKTNVYPEPTA